MTKKYLSVLDAEKNIGINTFLTKSISGVGGKLRVSPQDFKVDEIPISFQKKEKAKFLIAKVKAVNWENNLLIRELANRLHISRQRIGFAGTKDKRAETSQYMSFHKIKKENLEQLHISDVEISDMFYSSKPIRIGDLIGNKFSINIRNISNEASKEDIDEISDLIKNVGGFPNFFGVQRFGITRPVTHLVGKHLVNDNTSEAVLTYIGKPFDDENKEIYEARKYFDETHDYIWALKNYPNSMNYEKAILNSMVKNPEDFVSGLKQLPKRLLTMFIYAYQSYLFNKMLSERIKKDIPLNKAVEGDLVLPFRKGELDKKPVKVNSFNIDKVNTQIANGKAFVSGILVGFDSDFADGVMGEIERKVVDKENLDPRDFIIPDIPFISSSGIRRPLLSSVDDLSYDLNLDENVLNLSFTLKKGSYATCLLREFMKADNIKKY
jgi:tRNA pseudouridine13 synthase